MGGIVDNDRPIHVDGTHEPRIDVRHGRIIEEAASVPTATDVASAKISEAVIDAAVKPDSHSPVAGRPHKPEGYWAPAPISRRPKQPRGWWKQPCARDPEIAGRTPCPVTRSPNVPRRHYWRLRIGWYRRWRSVNHHAITHLYAIRHRHAVTQSA